MYSLQQEDQENDSNQQQQIRKARLFESDEAKQIIRDIKQKVISPEERDKQEQDRKHSNFKTTPNQLVSNKSIMSRQIDTY